MTKVLDCLGNDQLLRPIRGTGFVSESSTPMFSFVPATTDPNNAFARPNIGRLFAGSLRKRDKSPPSVTSSQQITECSITDAPQSFWNALLGEITQQGLVLAVAFDTPPAWADIHSTGEPPQSGERHLSGAASPAGEALALETA